MVVRNPITGKLNATQVGGSTYSYFSPKCGYATSLNWWLQIFAVGTPTAQPPADGSTAPPIPPASVWMVRSAHAELRAYSLGVQGPPQQSVPAGFTFDHGVSVNSGSGGSKNVALPRSQQYQSAPVALLTDPRESGGTGSRAESVQTFYKT